jgi:hypothetical protein
MNDREFRRRLAEKRLERQREEAEESAKKPPRPKNASRKDTVSAVLSGRLCEGNYAPIDLASARAMYFRFSTLRRMKSPVLMNCGTRMAMPSH